MTQQHHYRNSLDDAVTARVVSARAAACGMQPEDIRRLASAGFGDRDLVVRFHTGRTTITVEKFLAWQEARYAYPLTGLDREQLLVDDLRDVSGVALERIHQ
jgi:hypothetical protein